MNAEAEMALQFAKYGDVVVAFVVVQALAFAYGLGKEGSLKKSILRGYSEVMLVLFLAGITYLGLVGTCGYWENGLRTAAGQTGIVLRASNGAILGRGVIILFWTGLCVYALRRNKP